MLEKKTTHLHKIIYKFTQGKDDLTGEKLCRRPDDEPEVVQQRLHEFKTKTTSVIEYYEKRGVLRTFAGITTDEMWSDIVKYIHNYFS